MARQLTIRTFWSEEDGEFVSTCAEWPYLSGFGDTEADSVEDLKIVIDMAEEIEAKDNAIYSAS